MAESLLIENLTAKVEDTPILKGVTLAVQAGRVHALMGPNGSGKSTLSYTLLGHPKYEVTGGRVQWKGRDVLGQSPDERAAAGLFLAFQYPQEIPGVSLSHFLRTAVNNTRKARGEKELTVMQFRKKLRQNMELLKVPAEFEDRYLNEGFSGGEKKRAEMLQLAMLEPDMAILDETDSGLDIDALKVVSAGVNALRKARPQMGVLLITHYQRILNYIKPDRVHVMVDGRIAHEGDPELVGKLESEGYDWLSKAAA